MARLSSRAATVLACAVAAMVFAPMSVWAVDSFTNIAIQDPVSGTKAQVDSSGHLLVAGQRPLPAGSPWSEFVSPSLVTPAGQPRQSIKALTTATTGGIQLTSLTVSIPTGPPAGHWATVRIEELTPAAGQTSCAATTTTNPKILKTLYEITVTDSAPAITSFPTPLQAHGALVLGKLCLGAHITNGNTSVRVDASGYYGT